MVEKFHGIPHERQGELVVTVVVVAVVAPGGLELPCSPYPFPRESRRKLHKKENAMCGTYFHITSPDMRTIKTNATEQRAINAEVCSRGLFWKLASVNWKEKKKRGILGFN